MTIRLDPRQVARAIGGDAFGSKISAPGPGHSARDRSLSIRLDPSAPGGFVVHSHAGDDPIVCKDYVRQRLGLPAWEPGDEQERIESRDVRMFDRHAVDQELEPRLYTDDDLLRINRAKQIWSKAGDPRGTLAEQYLQSRCLQLPDSLVETVLRFHARCPWRNENTGNTEHVPALIVSFRSIDDDEITAIHRIALNPDGTKRGRRMLGIVHRAAVKLDPNVGDTLAIGEGVETCMAARQLGFAPAWALGSVGAISFFPVLEQIKTLKILSEAGKASADAIQLCGRRWTRAGRRVRIVRPPIGSDLNDTLMAEAAR
jgi:putative DNA primase/helicase